MTLDCHISLSAYDAEGFMHNSPAMRNGAIASFLTMNRELRETSRVQAAKAGAQQAASLQHCQSPQYSLGQLHASLHEGAHPELPGSSCKSCGNGRSYGKLLDWIAKLMERNHAAKICWVRGGLCFQTFDFNLFHSVDLSALFLKRFLFFHSRDCKYFWWLWYAKLTEKVGQLSLKFWTHTAVCETVHFYQHTSV